MLTDPIADMLTRIRNAVQARHAFTTMPASKMKIAIAQVLRDEGFIRGYQVLQDGPKRTLKIELAYTGKKEPLLTGLKRVSKPGLRVYVPADRIPRVYGGIGTAIVSTPKGIMTGEKARRLNLGGELVCTVW
jgi:small subunit ribosomal protein S8